MTVTTIASPDTQELFSKASAEIVTFLKSRVGKTTTLGLCGGRSVVGLLRAMLAHDDEELIRLLHSVHFFMVDERFVDISSADSNFKLLHDEFFSELIDRKIINENQLHPYRPEVSVDDYEDELKLFGNELTLVTLGVGEDGHIASLFPGHKELAINKATYLSLSDSPKPPPERITASPGLIEQASMAILLFVGEGKRAAYEKWKDKGVDFKDCPAKIGERVGHCVVVTDIS